MKQLGGYGASIYKKKHCSPNSKGDISCLNNSIIRKIAKIINNELINKSKEPKIKLNAPISDIHEDISKKLYEITGCSSESCWMKVKKIMRNMGDDKEKFIDSFKPQMPEKWISDYNTWLNTSDIEKCLDQYDDCNENFYFYGAVPIDFHKCKVSNLCSINIQKHLNKGEDKIGIVFNTDPHDEPGEHWISMFIDLKGDNLDNTPGIYYFDSYGDKAPKEIKNLVKKIKNQGKKINKELIYLYNDHPFQKKDAQCGMYAIHFIKEMLRLKDFKKFLNTKLTDNDMKNKRNEYFIHPDELKCKYKL